MNAQPEPATDADRKEFLRLWHDELKPTTERMLCDTPTGKLPFLFEHIAWQAWRKGRIGK